MPISSIFMSFQLLLYRDHLKCLLLMKVEIRHFLFHLSSSLPYSFIRSLLPCPGLLQSIYLFLPVCLPHCFLLSLPLSLPLPHSIPLFFLCFYFFFMQLPYIIGLQYFGLVCQAVSSWDGSSWPPTGISDDAIFNGFWWKGVIDKIVDE